MKRQKSLLLRLLTIVTITILAPSILTFLVFFRTVPERMETQAQANVGFYIDQTNSSVKNSMELAREVAFSALGDPMLQKNMQRTEFYLSSMGRGALEQMVGSVTAYQSAWSRNVLSSIYLFRDDGQYTFYSAKGGYAQEQRRMENICNQSLELSSAKTLFQIPGAPENMVYFLLDYKNIDTMAHLGKLVMELDVSSMVNADGLMELYPGTCLILSNTDGEPLYTLGDEPETADRVIADSNMESFSRLGTGHSRDRYYHVSRQLQGADANGCVCSGSSNLQPGMEYKSDFFCVLYSDPVTDDSRCLAGVLSGNAAFAGYGNGAAAHGCIGLYGKNALQ